MNKNHNNHILIIDDSSDQQTLLRIVLEASGYRIACTSNGEEALHLLADGNDLPDMILLDLNMPVMGGIGFRQKQSNDPRIMNIPVILMTGESDLQSTREKTTPNEFLLKPFNVASLIAAVERYSKLH
jgi:CheY-like chemotaxis protein